MNKRELVQALMAELGTDRREVVDFVNAYASVVARTLARGEPVIIANFCSITPSVGLTSNRPSPEVRVRFKPAPRLAEAMRNGDDQVTVLKRSKSSPRAA